MLQKFQNEKMKNTKKRDPPSFLALLPFLDCRVGSPYRGPPYFRFSQFFLAVYQENNICSSELGSKLLRLHVQGDMTS